MDELRKEFDELKLIIEIPKLYLSNYFAELRQSIDVYFAQISINQRNYLFNIWMEMIDRLNEFETKFLNNLKTFSLYENTSNIESIESQIKSFNSNEKIDYLIDLVIKEKQKIGRVLFQNMTIVLIDKRKPNWKDAFNGDILIKLIILKNDHLCKSSFERINSFKDNLTNEDLKFADLKAKLKNEDSFIVEINQTTLKEFIKSNAGLTKIEEDAFFGLKSLEVIKLPINEIEIVHPKVFNGLKNLKKLSLSNNRIEFLDNNLFKGLILLQELTLADNRMKSFDFKILNGLINLKHLDLNGLNVIEKIEAFTFKNLSNLEQLRLAENRISQIDVNGFSGLTKLKILYLGSNQLSEIKEKIFNELISLNQLYLNDNKIAVINLNSLLEIPNLTSVYISNNPILQNESFLKKVSNLNLKFSISYRSLN